MTKSLFQQYETYRKLYKPGTIWVDRGGHAVKRLEILDRTSNLNISYHIMFDWEGEMIPFRILLSSYDDGGLAGGMIIAWPTSYMERHYEVEK
jgi:hypothetical protein